MNKKSLLMIGLLASHPVYANGPNYQVFPQLNALSVNYHVEAKNKQTTIYATNHEKFPIICDAMMNTNKQEKSKGRETLIDPEKTVAFSFPHGSAITDVRVYLMCEASKDAVITDHATQTESASKTATAANPEITKEKSVPVLEEDLSNF
jgi:hypothetical protein